LAALSEKAFIGKRILVVPVEEENIK